LDDQSLFSRLRERLFTAVVGDVMDSAGLRRQFLPSAIRPLAPETTVIGRAMTVANADLTPTDPDDSFGLMLRALDDLKPNEVYVAAGGSPDYAVWGGLMSARATRLGATGAVLGGRHRDTREILALGFPVFSLGAYAQDQRTRGRATDFRIEIEFANGCRVAPGDVIFGDVDGVVVIPKGVAADVVEQALAKVNGEETVRRMIAEGETTVAAFAKTGIM
jgi:regulator of RNase E activity RraA